MENNYKIKIEPLKDDVIYETFGNHTRFELKNALAIGKFCFALQKFDDNNKQTAFIKCYMDIPEALAFANDILSGKFAKVAVKNGAPESIAKVFTSQGGSKKDGEIIYRTLDLSKGKLWMFKGIEQPGELNSKTGGYCAKKGSTPTNNVSVGVDDNALKDIAIMIQSEYQAYRTAQMLISRQWSIDF